MKQHNKRRILALLMTMVFSSADSSQADVPVRRRAADVFQLRDGTRLFGVLLDGGTDRGVRAMFRGQWLKQNAPELYESAINSAKTPTSNDDRSKEALIRHLQQLRAADEPDIERIGFLEERLTDLFPEQEQAAVAPDIVILKISNSLIRQKLLKTNAFRQQAGVAILNNLANAETSTPADLQNDLLKLTPATVVRSLPVAPSPSQKDELFERILLQADRVFGKTCRLIYQGGQFISESNGEQNLEQLAGQLLNGQVQSQLQQLLGGEFSTQKPRESLLDDDKLPQAASQLAERENADIVEVSSMSLQPANGRASVSLYVFHRASSDADWAKVASVTANATERDVLPENRQRIADDPRVKQVTQIFGGLGISGNEISKAVSIGAVVEVAQSQAKAKLTEQLTLTANPNAALNILEAKITSLPARTNQ